MARPFKFSGLVEKYQQQGKGISGIAWLHFMLSKIFSGT